MGWFGRLGSAAIFALAVAAPVRAETVVVECKISQSVTHGIKKVYSDAERGQSGMRERFAFNVPMGRGCIIVAGACDEKLGRLYVEQDESTITAKGTSQQVLLAYGFNRKAFFLLVGDDSVFSERDDCRQIELDIVMP